MDVLSLYDVPVWIFQLVCPLILIYMYGKYPGTIWKKLGVPSPSSTAFFGHVTQVFDPKKGISKTLGEWEKRYGKKFGIVLFREPMLVVSDLEIIKEVFITDFNNFSNRILPGPIAFLHPLMQKSLIINRGADWKRVRHTLTPSFSAAMLKRLTRHVNATSRNMTEVFRQHADTATSIDAKSIFYAYSLDIVAGNTLGLDINALKAPSDVTSNPFYQNASDVFTATKSAQVLIALVGIFPFLQPLFHLLGIKVSFMPVEKVEYFKELISKIIKERKKENCSDCHYDFLQFLLNAEYEPESVDESPVGKKLTEEEILSQAVTFIFGGLDGIGGALMWLSYEVGRNPEVQNKMMNEIEDVMGEGEKDVEYEHCVQLKYMEAVIKETLRMYPGSTLGRKLAKGKTNICGVNVPPEVGIMIPVYNIHHNPELFEDPMTFNPDRFMGNDSTKPAINPLAFLSFGSGPRQCIGVRQAMLQMKIALVHMLRAVRIEDVCPRKVDFTDIALNAVPKEPFKLILKQR